MFVYNPELLDEAELPTSMHGPAGPEWKGRWGAAPGGADFQAIVSAVLELEGEDATAAWLDGMKENADDLPEQHRDDEGGQRRRGARRGHLPLLLVPRSGRAPRRTAANTELHYFGNQDPGAFVSVSGGGVLESSAHQDEAQQFLAFLAGAAGQQILGEGYSFEYPVASGVPAKPPLPALDTLDAPAVDPSTLNGPRSSTS